MGRWLWKWCQGSGEGSWFALRVVTDGLGFSEGCPQGGWSALGPRQLDPGVDPEVWASGLQEIQSLLINWKGPDLTTYGELVLEGTFRVHRVRNERTFFLFDKALLITKKRGDHFVYKGHIPVTRPGLLVRPLPHLFLL